MNIYIEEALAQQRSAALQQAAERQRVVAEAVAHQQADHPPLRSQLGRLLRSGAQWLRPSQTAKPNEQP
jgi:hypothetical protein